MPSTHHRPQESLPGDLIGTDGSGKVRIDRVIPLHWVIGIIGAGFVNAAATYYGQQQLIEKVSDMREEIRSITAAINTGARSDMEHATRLHALERRMDQLESRK